jgi:spore coat polysaccharide biosynthesis predicted glycosyltransferase SpsG
MPHTPRYVIFAVAAGPSVGYGHLVRAGHLAGQLGVRRVLALRGGGDAIDAALAMGWTVHRGSPLALAATLPDLIVVDDPSSRHARRWVRAARQYDVPVAAVHDGDGRGVGADLSVDGSLMAAATDAPAARRGPAFAILDPRVAGLRTGPVRQPRSVLIALGGGRHVRDAGVRIAATLHRLDPAASILLAPGFVDRSALPGLPARCRWIPTPQGLADALARTSVAIVAGGMTLYEACALGTPAVAVPVVKGQRRAVRAAARLGVAVAASTSSAPRRAHDLLSRPLTAAALGRRARRVVDGAGARRVADALRALTESRQTKGARRAA